MPPLQQSLDTDKLITFLGNHFHKNQIIKRHSRLSDISKHMFFNIIHQMELAENSWKLCPSYNEYILPENTLPKGPDYNFILDEIKCKLETSKKIGKRYFFTIGSRNFTIYLIKPYHTKTIHLKNTYHMLDNMLQKIYIALYTLSHYARGECSTNLNIYIYMTDHKKMLPEKKGEPINIIHANTAFTYTCSNNPNDSNSIYIFRQEEWFKVLIHECFHSMGLDFSNMNQHAVDTQLVNIFKNSFNQNCIDCNNIRFYETYCEMWGELINIIFICVRKYKRNTASIALSIMDMKKVSKLIESYIQLECLFSLFQCAKILQHNNLTYRELFIPTDSSTKYVEKTNVFSYYFLKTICMFYSNDFIEWCVEHNHNSIAFRPTQKNILELFVFISHRYDSSEFIRNIEIFENWFSEHQNKKTILFEMNTLRMSISEDVST